MELIIGREAGASRLRISINNQDRFLGERQQRTQIRQPPAL